MFEVSYTEMLAVITILWIAVRFADCVRTGSFSARRELKMLTAYICLIVIARFVYFPWKKVNGHIDMLRFDISRIYPPRMNIIPLVHMPDVYDGWQINLIGNVLMFVPVGLIWPFCFKKLDSVKKTAAAAALFSFLIETSQLLFYERYSDIDDLIMNTCGAVAGACIYFGIGRSKRDD